MTEAEQQLPPLTVSIDLTIWLNFGTSLVALVIMLGLVFLASRKHRPGDPLLAVLVSLTIANGGLALSALSIIINDFALGLTARGITRVALLMIAIVYLGLEIDRWRQR